MTSVGGGTRTAVVLGGGVGGVVAATRLRSLLPDGRIVLVEREPFHLFQPSLLWLAVGWRRTDDIRRPMERLKRKGIEVVAGDVTAVDAEARTVTVGNATIAADALIVALGAELAPDVIPGLAASGHNLYTVEGASAISSALETIRSGRIVVLTAAPVYKCPAAPYEAAMLIDGALRKRSVRSTVDVALFAAEPGPMGVAGPAVSQAVRQMVESKGVAYHPGHQVTSVDAGSRRLAFANGVTADFDLLVYVPPHRAPAVVLKAHLTNEAGWIPVNRGTLETKFPGVYAIGDVTTIPLTMGKPLPKAGVFAHAQADVVAANIAHAWTGRGAPQVFDGRGECFIETGDGRAGMGYGDFYGEPVPHVKTRGPSRLWHWAKVILEKRWLSRF